MDVVFRIVRHIIVDDKRNIGDINASRDDVCGHEYTHFPVPEIQHDLISFVLLQITMHRTRVNM
jgi:hypothetical protein